MNKDWDNGWNASARAWIADMGSDGDFGRRHILDAPMLAQIVGHNIKAALDVGCGEGRFCRKLAKLGIPTVGIDPTEVLIAEAKRRHPDGVYHVADAEALPFADASFDLVISYLSLIDIPDVRAAIAEMRRVLAPGGKLLIANLTSFNTGRAGSAAQTYLEEFSIWQEWRGIRVRNWHRPLGVYITLLIDAGLVLRHFDEPAPTGGDPAETARYRKMPWFLIMAWQLPPP